VNFRRSKIIRLVVTLLGFWCASCANPGELPAPLETPISSQSPIALQNGEVKLIVDPRIGRMVYFGRPSGPNLLWTDPYAPATAAKETGGLALWMNWGGDKLWYGPQSLWPSQIGRRFPPDSVFDGQPWNVISQDRNQVVIESRESPSIGGRLLRTITLHGAEPIVDFDNAFIRTQPSAIPIQLWTVSQVMTPDRCMLDVLSDVPSGDCPIVAMGPPLVPAAKVIHSRNAQWMEFKPSAEPETKVGTFGNWVASASNDAFVQISRYQPGMPYPERSSVQAYTNGKWVEIETVSPMVFPRVGETVHHWVRWLLLKNMKGSQATVESINGLVQQN
jgi:hypothetical protein